MTKPLLTIFLLLSMLCSCTTIGPKMLPQTRRDFNGAIQSSDQEQILINLVRMYYTDTPYFMNVASISAQLSYGATVGANYAYTGANGFEPTNLSTINPNANIAYIERPTITYSPLQGENFTRQMLSPIKMQTIVLLLQSGWSVSRVLRTISQAIGPLSNAPSASRPQSSHLPEYKQFVTTAHLIRTLQLSDHLDLVSTESNKVPSLSIIIDNKHANREVYQLLSLLNLPRSTHEIHFVQGQSERSNTLPIHTRSLLGVMYYLSKSVELVQEDIDAGLVKPIRLNNGQIFNWNDVTRGMMKIHIAKTRPLDAWLSIYYRKRWYYIADNDLDSKQTMTLLSLLFSLQSGNQKTVGPILSLPI